MIDNVHFSSRVSPTMSARCVECKELVRKSQKAVMCDACDGWQYRKCNTNINRPTYFKGIRGIATIKSVGRSCT